MEGVRKSGQGKILKIIQTTNGSSLGKLGGCKIAWRLAATLLSLRLFLDCSAAHMLTKSRQEAKATELITIHTPSKT